MRVRDFMTSEVITVRPETSIKQAAEIMVEGEVSGIVVVGDDQRVIGVVSEADYVEAESSRGAPKRASLLRWFSGSGPVKAAATRVEDIMTSPVVTIGPDENHRSAARIMAKKHVKRLPVVEDGRLVGIVSRMDIVRVFDRVDEEIVDEIVNELMPDVLWIDPRRANVESEDGEVHLSGQMATRADAELLAALAARVDGVITVESELTWEFDPEEKTRQPELQNPFRPNN